MPRASLWTAIAVLALASVAQAQYLLQDTVLRVNGEELLGNLAAFGPVPSTDGLTGTLVVASTNASSTDSFGCGPLAAAPSKGALLASARGNCSFVTKALAAQAAGYVGLVIYDSMQGYYYATMSNVTTNTPASLAAADACSYWCGSGSASIPTTAVTAADALAGYPGQCGGACGSGLCVLTKSSVGQATRQLCCATSDPLIMGGSGAATASVKVPTIFLSLTDGAKLVKAAVAAGLRGEPLTVTSSRALRAVAASEAAVGGGASCAARSAAAGAVPASASVNSLSDLHASSFGLSSAYHTSSRMLTVTDEEGGAAGFAAPLARRLVAGPAATSPSPSPVPLTATLAARAVPAADAAAVGIWALGCFVVAWASWYSAWPDRFAMERGIPVSQVAAVSDHPAVNLLHKPAQPPSSSSGRALSPGAPDGALVVNGRMALLVVFAAVAVLVTLFVLLKLGVPIVYIVIALFVLGALSSFYYVVAKPFVRWLAPALEKKVLFASVNTPSPSSAGSSSDVGAVDRIRGWFRGGARRGGGAHLPLEEATAVAEEAEAAAAAVTPSSVTAPSSTAAAAPSSTRRVSKYTAADALSFAITLTIVAVWFFCRTTSWSFVLQDLLGAALCGSFLLQFRLKDLSSCTLVLLVFFLYDIFMVFISPAVTGGDSIMIDVATAGQATGAAGVANVACYCRNNPDDRSVCGPGEFMPILLRLPRLNDWRGGYTMLGLGDIIIPGLALSAALRRDAAQRTPGFFGIASRRRREEMAAAAAGGFSSVSVTATSSRDAPWAIGYWWIALAGYFLGLAAANVAVSMSGKGQPALLYLVPCVLIPLAVVAHFRNDLSRWWKVRNDVVVGADTGLGGEGGGEESSSSGLAARLTEGSGGAAHDSDDDVPPARSAATVPSSSAAVPAPESGITVASAADFGLGLEGEGGDAWAAAAAGPGATTVVLAPPQPSTTAAVPVGNPVTAWGAAPLPSPGSDLGVTGTPLEGAWMPTGSADAQQAPQDGASSNNPF